MANRSSCPHCGKYWPNWAVATLLATLFVALATEAVGLIILSGTVATRKVLHESVSKELTAMTKERVECHDNLIRMGEMGRVSNDHIKLALTQRDEAIAKYNSCFIK